MQAGASPSEEALAEAHARLVADRSLQFEPSRYTPPEPVDPPAWLQALGAFVQLIAPLLKVLFWVGVVALVAAILWVVVREVMKWRAPKARAEKPKAEIVEEWRPTVADARDLLDSADALAAEGRYAEAAHLILLRSVEDIHRRQPRAVAVSHTTREIGALSALPESARPAFVEIGRVVEQSLFGGRDVDRDTFQRCRRSYEAFALPDGWRA